MDRAAPCRFLTRPCKYIFLPSPRALIMNLHRMINIVANWTSALAGAGIPTLEAPNGGVTMGAFISPSSINPANWTRSYSRSAYIDSLPPRGNLHILPGATVTRLLFSDSSSSSSGLIVNSVEFMNSADNKLMTISVRREAILAGGSLGSPKILLHSGVGPKDVLDAAGVPVKLELPGVGQHLQDHLVCDVPAVITSHQSHDRPQA
jgi:choline dehydrogenase